MSLFLYSCAVILCVCVSECVRACVSLSCQQSQTMLHTNAHIHTCSVQKLHLLERLWVTWELVLQNCVDLHGIGLGILCKNLLWHKILLSLLSTDAMRRTANVGVVEQPNERLGNKTGWATTRMLTSPYTRAHTRTHTHTHAHTRTHTRTHTHARTSCRSP